MAGAPIPADMQGKSLVPLLRGKTPADWRSSLYYHYYEGGGHGVQRHEGVTTKRYKLIRFYSKAGEAWELYDLKRDPREMTSVHDNPEYEMIRETLHKELVGLKNTYGVPSP